MRRRIAVGLTGVLLITTASTAVVIFARDASLEREWEEDVRVLSGVERLPGGAVRLTGVRDWRYSRDSVASKAYVAVRYDPADITGLWLYEQDLGFGGRIAHTFLVFEFPETYGSTRWLGLSVEARREAGEAYSVIGGAFRSFEVTHVWATEEDLVTRRVELLDYALTRYRMTVRNEYLERIFRQFVNETEALGTSPRWYNTLTTNCTSALIAYVNEAQPGAIPWHYSQVLTGRADAYLARLGYLNPASAQLITREWLTSNPLR